MTRFDKVPRRIQRSKNEFSHSLARCSANLVEELRDAASKLYERAKRARQNLVRLAPQYRNKDEYNAEGEYLQDIRITIGMRRIALTLAQRLESESSPNS